MMIGNIVGKVLVSFMLSALFGFYFVINPQKENKRKALNVKDIFMIINFTSSGKR